jgi:hypothetical protein
MPSSDSCNDFILLIDHYNLPFSNVTPRSIIETWIARVVDTSSANIVQVKVRAYGGWFIGSTASDGRFRASEYYQNNCPSLFKIKNSYCRVSFEFADNLIPLAQSSITCPAIENTLVIRKSTQQIKFRPDAPLCNEPDCELRTVRRWLRKRRACFRQSCPHVFSDHFIREEQKQVDVHLAVDLLQLAMNGSLQRHIALATDDNDFLPALAAAAVNHPTAASLSHIRFDTDNTYMDEFFKKVGVDCIAISSLPTGGQ